MSSPTSPVPPVRRWRAAIVGAALAVVAATVHAGGDLERQELKFGFIKLTDCAPLIVAYEKESAMFAIFERLLEMWPAPNMKALGWGMTGSTNTFN